MKSYNNDFQFEITVTPENNPELREQVRSAIEKTILESINPELCGEMFGGTPDGDPDYDRAIDWAMEIADKYADLVKFNALIPVSINEGYKPIPDIDDCYREDMEKDHPSSEREQERLENLADDYRENGGKDGQ